jgi:hypothetical protein
VGPSPTCGVGRDSGQHQGPLHAGRSRSGRTHRPGRGGGRGAARGARPRDDSEVDRPEPLVPGAGVTRWEDGWRPTASSWSRSTSTSCRSSMAPWVRWRCACCTPTSTPPTNRLWPCACASRVTTCAAPTRCLPSPRVRADLHHRGERLPAPGVRVVPAGPRRAAGEVLVLTSAGGLVARRRSVGGPRLAAVVAAGRRRAGGSGGGGGVWLARCRDLRHGWHQHRRVPRSRWEPPVVTPAEGGRLPGAAAVARHPHRGRRRWLSRPPRPRRCAGRRSVVGRSRSRSACYGRGGVEPTVTDADMVLGRIPAGAAFPGLVASTSTQRAPPWLGPGWTPAVSWPWSTPPWSRPCAG